MTITKTFSRILILTIIGSCSSGKPDHPFIYHGIKAESPVTVNGIPDEPVWQNAEEITLKDNDTGAEVTEPSLITRVKSCYDANNLYILFTCNDPDIWCNYTQRDDSLWKQEVIEVFINTDETPGDYVELEVSPSNILFDSFITDTLHIDVVETAKFNLEQIQTAVKADGTVNVRDDTDRTWVVEMAVPFKEMLNGKTMENLISTGMTVNFYRFNRDNGKEAGKYAWSPTGGRFHQPSKFGQYRFVK